MMDELREIVRELKDERLSIIWIPDHDQDVRFTQDILMSIDHRKTDLTKFIKSSGADIEMIAELRTDFYLKANKQIAIEAIVIDDQGRTYISPVYKF